MSRWYGTREWTKEYLEFPQDIRAKLETEHPRKDVTQRKSVYTSSIKQLVEDAKEFAEEWNRKFDDVNLSHQVEEEYGNTSSSAYLELAGLETDTQWHQRLIEMHESNQWREKHDRAEFDRLKAKFK